MRPFLKKIILFIGVVLAFSAVTTSVIPRSAYADNSCRDFMGLVSWDCNTGFTDNKTPDDKAIKTGIWTVAANIATDITVIAAYLVLGYVIYGGYQYIFSAGDPGKVASGKRTLAHAFIGLAIVMSANIIMNTIRIALGVNFNQNCATGQCGADPGTMVTNAIQWVIGVSALVAVIFVVYGGVAYMTSAGDPSKVQKAKNTIMYALIGLAIVALAEAITAFVSSTIKNASYLDETVISKEVDEVKVS